MLFKRNEIIEKYNLLDGSENIKKMDCWVKEEMKYKIYIFTVEVGDSMDLYKSYKCITNNIAFDFQPKLKLNIERWNVYLIFITDKCISAKIKYAVEQDIFAVRKIVFDQLIIKNENDIKMAIENKLFNIFSKKLNTDLNINLKKLIEKKNLKYYRLLNIEDEKKFFEKYVEELHE